MSKRSKGITLIALVITIIVLLILAGVTINLVLRENGIFGTAQKAASEYKKAETEEQIKLAYNEAMTEYYISGANVRNTFERALRTTYSNATVEGEEEPYTVTINGEVYEVAGDNVAKSVEAKYRPVVTYIIGETADATENMVAEGDLEEGTELYVIVRVSIESGEINSVTAGEGLELDETNTVESEGKYVYKVTKGGKYNLTIVSNNGTENKYTKKATIAVNGIYEEPITAENVSVGAKTTTTHDEKELNYTWGELLIIADKIADTRSITYETTEVTVNGVTIGVGDYKIIGYDTGTPKKVRILGFNHDNLTTPVGTRTKAGITFEFVTLLGKDKMNTQMGYTGGWESSSLKEKMPTYLAKIDDEILRNGIKEVNKECSTSSTATESATSYNNKLWLLSCSEIWNNGKVEGCNYGLTIAKEGERYRFFALKNPSQSGSAILKKWVNISESSSVQWWLRSPDYAHSHQTCRVDMDTLGAFSSRCEYYGGLSRFCNLNKVRKN